MPVPYTGRRTSVPEQNPRSRNRPGCELASGPLAATPTLVAATGPVASWQAGRLPLRQPLLAHVDRLFVARQRGHCGRARVHRLAIAAVRLGAQVRRHVMAAPRRPLVAQRVEVEDGEDHLLTGTGVGLGEGSAVEVDDHAAARPAERRVVA